MAAQQTYANHVRYFPLVHFVIVPLLLIVLIWNAVLLYQAPSWTQAFVLLFCIIVGLVNLAARLQALRVQDRVIRNEERLRYKELLSPEIAARASDLPIGRIIALRFASDGELAEMVLQVLDGKLNSSKEIKMAVKNWRGDYLRV